MKKLKINVTETVHVKDELKIEKVQGMDHVLWKGRHYYPDVTWYKIRNEEELQESFARNKKLNGKFNLKFKYGDESISALPNELEEDILLETDDNNYLDEVGYTLELSK